MEDFEDAILSHRKALTLCPLGHPDRSSSLLELAYAHHTRFEQLGRTEDLEDAISFLREALNLRYSPLGHPDHSMSLNNLALKSGV